MSRGMKNQDNKSILEISPNICIQELLTEMLDINAKEFTLTFQGESNFGTVVTDFYFDVPLSLNNKIFWHHTTASRAMQTGYWEDIRTAYGEYVSFHTFSKGMHNECLSIFEQGSDEQYDADNGSFTLTRKGIKRCLRDNKGQIVIKDFIKFGWLPAPSSNEHPLHQLAPGVAYHVGPELLPRVAAVLLQDGMWYDKQGNSIGESHPLHDQLVTMIYKVDIVDLIGHLQGIQLKGQDQTIVLQEFINHQPADIVDTHGNGLVQSLLIHKFTDLAVQAMTAGFDLETINSHGENIWFSLADKIDRDHTEELMPIIKQAIKEEIPLTLTNREGESPMDICRDKVLFDECIKQVTAELIAEDVPASKTVSPRLRF